MKAALLLQYVLTVFPCLQRACSKGLQRCGRVVIGGVLY